jgi:hypothetical protein
MRAAFVTLAVLAGLVVAVPVPAARAQDVEKPSDPAFLYYEAAKRKILKSAGNKVWDAAEQAKRRNFFQYATMEAERAIEFDPNQADAREYLGYVKKGKEWVLDQDAASKVQRTNVRASKNGKQESQESFQKRIDEWKEKYLEKANEFVAARYAVLGDDCAKKGYPLQARKGYEAALRLDADNKKARKGLGYKRMGKVWLGNEQDDAREQAAKAEEVKEGDRWDGVLGAELAKAESRHFRVEGRIPVEECKEICFALETGYAYYLSDLGIDPTKDVFDGRRATFVFMEDGEQWEKWCNAFGGDEFTRKTGGTGNTSGLIFGHRMREQSTPLQRKDSALHQAIHMMNLKVFDMRGGAWINEGLSYYYSVKVQETCLTHCVALKKGQYANQGQEGGLKDWNDSNNWKPNVRELVDRKADVELRELVIKPITQLEFEATIKAWSVIQWMMDTDRDDFIALLGRLGGQGNHVKILESEYEKSLEDLDIDWREYVLRNY